MFKLLKYTIVILNILCLDHHAVRASPFPEDTMYQFGLAYTGPRFEVEPRDGLSFTNLAGGSLHCSGSGYPLPDVQWEYDDGEPLPDVQALRQTLSNGSLWLMPFPPDEYRHDVHSTSVRCRLSNAVGEIVSAAIAVKAAITEIDASTGQADSLAGCVVIVKCGLPESAKDNDSPDLLVEHLYILPHRVWSTGEKRYPLPQETFLVRNPDQINEDLSSCRPQGKFAYETAVTTAQKIIIYHSNSPIINPSILEQNRTVYRTVGGNQNVSCLGPDCPDTEYRWSRIINGNTVPLNSDTTKPMGHMLAFNKLSVSDDGIYRCNVKNPHGMFETAMRLIVIGQVEASITPYLLVVPRGRQAELTCSISPAANRRMINIAWYKNGKMIPMEGDVPNKLILSAVTRLDEGMYQCIARGPTGELATAASQIRLDDEKPTIVVAFTEKTIHPGPPLVLTCFASGVPLPFFRWEADGFPLTNNSRIEISEMVIANNDYIQSTMDVTKTTSGDSANYTCKAINRAGQAEQTIRINVYGPPQIRPMPNQTGVLDRTFRLKCPVGGYPIDKITWERDGQELPINIRQTVLSDGTLMISTVQKLDAGAYTCKAGHSGTTASESFNLEVVVPPEINPLEVHNLTINLGERTSMTCSTLRGDPPLSVSWERNNRSLKGDQSITITEVKNHLRILTIENATIEHAGEYTCRVANRVGEDQKSRHLFINVPPRWVVEPLIDAQALVGETKNITCLMFSIPPVKVTWKKVIGGKSGGRYEDIVKPDTFSEDGTLIIKRVTENSSGTYLCHGTNGIGSGISKLITLKVNTPPTAPLLNIGFVAVQVGGVAKLLCTANGTSPLSAKWTKESNDDGLTDTARYNISDKSTPTGLRSMLVISDVESSDSTFYKCDIRNLYGNTSVIVFLFALQEPRPLSPYNVIVYENNKTSVTVTWEHQKIDNGSVLFIVEYSDSFGKWEAIYVADDSPRKIIVNDLSPGNIYMLRVKASNRGGISPPSPSLGVEIYADLPTIPSIPLWTAFDHEPSPQPLQINWREKIYNELNNYQHADPKILINLTIAGININLQCLVNREENITTTRIRADSNNSCMISGDGETNLLGDFVKLPDKNITTSFSSPNADWAKSSVHNPVVKKNVSQCGTSFEGKIVYRTDDGKTLPILLNMFVGIGGLSDGLQPSEFIKQKPGITILNFNRWPSESTCPIASLLFKYRKQGVLNWTSFSHVRGPHMVLGNLVELTPYDVIVLAHNGAGTAVFNYNFSTLEEYPQDTSTSGDNHNTYYTMICGKKTPSRCFISYYLFPFVALFAVLMLLGYLCTIQNAPANANRQGGTEVMLEMNELTNRNAQSRSQRRHLSGTFIRDGIIPRHTFQTQRSQRNQQETTFSSDFPIFIHRILTTHEPYIPQITNEDHTPTIQHMHHLHRLNNHSPTQEHCMPLFPLERDFPRLTGATLRRHTLQNVRRHPASQIICEPSFPRITHEIHHPQIHRFHDSPATPYFPRVTQEHHKPMITQEFNIPMETHEPFIPLARTADHHTPFDTQASSFEDSPRHRPVQKLNNRFEAHLSIPELSTSESNQPNSSQPESSPLPKQIHHLIRQINTLTANIISSSSDSISTDRTPQPRRPPPRRLHKRSTLASIHLQAEEDAFPGTSNQSCERRHRSQSLRVNRNASRNGSRAPLRESPTDPSRAGSRDRQGRKFSYSSDYSIDV